MKKLAVITALACALSFPLAAQANAEIPRSYMEQALTGLPKEKAEDFRDIMQHAHEDNKDLYDQVQQLHKDMREILVAETFDKDAFISKNAELRQLQEKISTNLDQAFADAVSGLSASERLQLADTMKQQHKIHKAKKAK